MYTLYKKHIPHDCSTDNRSCREMNYINTKQQQERDEVVTVRDAIARKINKKRTRTKQDI